MSGHKLFILILMPTYIGSFGKSNACQPDSITQYQYF